ncbi:SRPBCC family protein [Streptomyces chartreusis]|uniref:SRPBCC family protein n=1 Tax=Streptomyces chartreusis TaxID=1969 RepID=UPI0038298A06
MPRWCAAAFESPMEQPSSGKGETPCRANCVPKTLASSHAPPSGGPASETSTRRPTSSSNSWPPTPRTGPAGSGRPMNASMRVRPPYGVGTTRRLRLYRLVRAREILMVWDAGEQFAYRVHQTNARGVTAVMERWALTPSAGGRTRVSWTIAVDCAPPVRLLLRVSRRHVDRVFQDAMKRFEGLCRHP